MINKKVLIMFALLLSQQSFAYEKQGFYLGIGLDSRSIRKKSSNNSDLSILAFDSTSVRLGYAKLFNNHNYRVEIEGLHIFNALTANRSVSSIPVSDREVVVTTVYKKLLPSDVVEDKCLASIYHDWKKGNLYPYVGAGVGIKAGSLNPIIYELKVGTNYHLTKYIYPYIGLKYFNVIDNGVIVNGSENSGKEETIIMLSPGIGIEYGLTVHFAS